MPTTITTPARMTDAQFATVLYFAGGPTPSQQGIKVSSGMQSDAACLRRGWLVEIEQFPFKKATHEGLEAAGLYIDQHDGHALDIQEFYWHCHTCRVFQAPHHARPAPEPTHLWTGAGSQHHAVCGEPTGDGLKTAPDIKDVDCPACIEAYGDYSILLRNELARWSKGESPYDTPLEFIEGVTDPARRDAALTRRLGMTKTDAAAVLEHIAETPALTEATAVALAYREVGGEVDPQTDAAADPEMVAAGIRHLHGELLTQQVLTVVGHLANDERVIKGVGGWLVHEVRPGAECRPISDGVVEEAIRRGSARTYTNPLTGLTTLHLPPIGGTLNPPPPKAGFVDQHAFDAGPEMPAPDARCIATACGMLEQAHLSTEYPRRAVLDLEVAGRKLSEFTERNDPGWFKCPHPHQTNNPAGYVVKWTVAENGHIIEWNGDVGEDLAVFLCRTEPGFDPAYSDALAAAKLIRAMGMAWAVVDFLWPCGHRS